MEREELLQQVEEFAGLMFSRDEIADIIDIDRQRFTEMVTDKEDDVQKAFRRGRLLREAQVRKSIFDLAGNGSSPAQAFAAKLIENAKMEDL